MRRFLIWALCVLAAVSCVREIEPPTPPCEPFPEGEPVTVTFSIPGMDASPATRAGGFLPLGEETDLQTLHLAVFGSSGYLKEYVKATLKSTTTDPVKGVIYTFSARLTLSESERSIHFIGNGDDQLLFDDAKAVLPPMVTAEGHQGFWQMVELTQGILAKTDSEGYYIDEDGNRSDTPEFKGYVVDETTHNLLKNIPLVRNWAKVQVTAEPGANFIPLSYAFVNVPSRGTIVPYSTNPTFLSQHDNSGFVKNYNDYDFEQLRLSGYESNLPAGVTFNNTIPAAEDFENAVTQGARNGVVPANNVEAVYLYERCVPSDEIPPSYVIIYGTYWDPDKTGDANYQGERCYYKIDLMDENGYYPIFRNFCYLIVIRSILRKGQNTPAEAAAAAGSADVSADITTQHISEVSDGYARMAIDPWMSHTFIDEIDKETDDPVLFAKLVIDDTNSAFEAYDAEVIPFTDNSPDIIQNVTFGAEDNGWVPVLFDLKRPVDPETGQPLEATKTQTLRIFGKYTKTSVDVQTQEPVTSHRRLYRDVVITLLKKQEMRVHCQNKEVLAKIGEPQAVDIWIPAGLVSSMFPLVFTIEAEKSTLSPDLTPGTRPLPVKPGSSISDNPDFSGKNTFQYTCTLTWDDYLSLNPKRIMDNDGSEHVWRIFTCNFITTSERNATDVYVENEYFEKANDSFVNVDDPSEDFGYFHVIAREACYLKINRNATISYCHKYTSRGETLRSEWETYTNNTAISLGAGDVVWFRASVAMWDEGSAPENEIKFLCYKNENNPNARDGAFDVGGNIASLIVGGAFEESGPTVTGYSFSNFFKNHTGLVDASKLELPMLAASVSCYKSMFEGCTSLTNAPELPATTLAASCYHGMFNGCTALTEAPVLPAETLVSNCYFEMFKGCSNLLSVTCLATSGINTDGSTTDWLDGVPNTEVRHGTFTINPAAHVRGDREGSGNTWPMSIHGIPTYWMITNGLVPVFPDNPFDDQVDF